MATNNPANDRYNPPSNMSIDYEEYSFSELEVDELFWQSKNKTENPPWRKVSQTEAINLQSQKTYKFDLKTKVFQKI